MPTHNTAPSSFKVHFGVVESELNSMTNPDVTETMNSMDFHTLSIDEAKTQELLLFRLAENITAVLVHERVKLAIEAAGITNLTWFAPEEWAG